MNIEESMFDFDMRVFAIMYENKCSYEDAVKLAKKEIKEEK
jgi:hypothetical protein